MANNIQAGDDLLRNSSLCPGSYCVEATIYRKIIGTIVFVVIWPFIVVDIRFFPLGRPAAALLGATLMVIFAIVPQDQVYGILGEKGNLQTLFLLFGMMLMSYYYDREGILQRIALWIFGDRKPFKSVLWKVCVFSAILSAVITNDATCLVVTPLLLREHMKQGRSEKELTPLLLGIATSSNIGSAATFFGNPQNAFIAANSEGKVSLTIFFAASLPAAVIGLGVSTGILYLFYLRQTCTKQQDVMSPLEPLNNTNSNTAGEALQGDSPMENSTLAKSRQEMALSYDNSVDPYLSSELATERGNLYCNETSTSVSTMSSAQRKYSHYFDVNFRHGGVYSLESSVQDHVTPTIAETSLDYGAVQTSDESRITPGNRATRTGKGILTESSSNILTAQQNQIQDSPDQEESQQLVVPAPHTSKNSPSTWRNKMFTAWLVAITILLVILLAVPPPPVVSVEFNLGLVPVGVGVLTMLTDTALNRKYPFDAMQNVDWGVILMFMGLFVWIAGFENTQFPAEIFSGIKPHMDLLTVGGVLLFTLFVTAGSNVLSNVPLVIIVVDQLFSLKCGNDSVCSAQLTGMILAWVSTIAGNFTLVGSVANLIVAEKARCVADHRLTFWVYLKFGFFSTTIVLFMGLPIVYFISLNIRI